MNLLLTGLLIPLFAQLLDRLLHPLDNVLSIQQKTGYGFLATVLHIYKSQGLRGFYAGFKRPFLTFGLARVAMTSFYMNFKFYLLSLEYTFLPSVLLCGLLAGAIDATLTAPGENYRTRAVFQLNPPKGVRENYTGYSALLLRSIFGATIILAGSDILITHAGDMPFIHHPFLAAFTMGIFSQVFTSPLDVWKNAIISDPKIRPLAHLQNIVSNQQLYRGLRTKMLRMGLGAGVVISTLYALLSYVR